MFWYERMVDGLLELVSLRFGEDQKQTPTYVSKTKRTTLKFGQKRYCAEDV